MELELQEKDSEKLRLTSKNSSDQLRSLELKSKLEKIFRIFIVFNMCFSLVFGTVCLIVHDELFYEDYETFELILTYSTIDIFGVLVALSLSGLFYAMMHICDNSTMLQGSLGCFPIFYKLFIYIGYTVLTILTIIWFSNLQIHIVDTLVLVFFIYEMIAAALFILKGIYDFCNKNFNSPHVVEIETNLFQVDENRLRDFRKEVLEQRKNFLKNYPE